MKMRQMHAEDIALVLPLYIEYYNEHDGSSWTEETAGRRIRQVITMQDSRVYLLEENGDILGFAMGYLKQYDDLMGYMLEEIVIALSYQNKGYGTAFFHMLEAAVKEDGAALIELSSVNDEHHAHFYNKVGMKASKSFVPMVKFLE